MILWKGSQDYYDSFSLIFDRFQQITRTCIEVLDIRVFREAFIERPLPLLGPLADMRKSIQNSERHSLGFGEAVKFVAGSNCTCYRDRYLAMSSFLKCGDYASTVRNRPYKAANTCLWLARKCLSSGDYSP